MLMRTSTGGERRNARVWPAWVPYPTMLPQASRSVADCNTHPELAASSVFRSVMRPSRHITACATPPLVCASPTTTPFSLMARAYANEPPRPGRVCIVPFTYTNARVDVLLVLYQYPATWSASLIATATLLPPGDPTSVTTPPS